MGSVINRREFIKLMASLPLMKLAMETSYTPGINFSPQNPGSPNILILVFDALSARNVSLYGYPRETTPNISKFAENATVFHRHYAGGSFTSPGTASILTGSYPWTHRAFHLYGTVTREFEKNNIFNGFLSDTYRRMVFTHNDLANLMLYQFDEDVDIHKKTAELCLYNEYFMADNIFPRDHNATYMGEWTLTRGQKGEGIQLPSSVYYSALSRVWRTNRSAKLRSEYKKLFPRGLPGGGHRFFLLEDAIDWVMNQTNNSSQPYLGYFHFLPPHKPFNTRKEFINIFDDGWRPLSKSKHFFSKDFTNKKINRERRKYDEFIAYVDAEFGRLVDFMSEHGFLDNTYLILTTDHGEMFERGILYHSTETLYEPITHVPLIISRPGQDKRVDVHTPTSCTDLLPTIHHVTGRPIPEWCEGELLPTFSDSEINPDRSIYTVEAKTNPKTEPIKKGTIAMVKNRYKLIYYFGYRGRYRSNYEMYDLKNDPEEMDDLYSETNDIARDMKAELQTKLDQVNGPYM
jgi:arylsulfatase A-like enzyme